jgi:hypothetical protein
MYSVSAPRNVIQKAISDISKKSTQPVQDQLNIRYGVITKVSDDTSQVKVKLYTNAGKPDLEIQGFLPLINPLSEIHLLWGKLAPGLAVRVFFRGKENPQTGIVEVIGDEGLDFLKKERKANILNTGPYKLLSGGLLG